MLFFYPAAMTSGCTKEACHFRDVAAEFAAAGVQRVGISRDAVAKQKQFADMHGFDYPLLSDADGAVAEIFGVARRHARRPLGAPVKRWTFVIGRDRKVVKVDPQRDQDGPARRRGAEGARLIVPAPVTAGARPPGSAPARG